MDMFEAEFGGVVFTGAEGWSAQHGEASLNSRVGGDIAEDEADSQPAAETETQGQAPRQTQPAAQTHSGGSSSSPNSKRRRKHPKYGLVKWIKLVTATMALHNFIRDSHREDHDFVQWQNGDDGEGEADSDGDEEEGDDDDDDEKDDGGGGGGRIVYEPTGDRAMEDLRDNITNEYGRGRLPY